MEVQIVSPDDPGSAPLGPQPHTSPQPAKSEACFDAVSLNLSAEAGDTGGGVDTFVEPKGIEAFPNLFVSVPWSSS